MAEVRMPKMGDGMEEGTITTWLKKEGDQVHSGDVIAEIETDKANVEITSYEAGTLHKIVIPVGQTVPVGEVIAIVGEASATSASNGAAPAADTGAKAATNGDAMPPANLVSHNVASLESVLAAAPRTERVKASPLARRMAEDLGVDLALVNGSGSGGVIKARDVEAFQSKGGKSLPTVEAAPAPVGATAAAATPTPMVRSAPPAPSALVGQDIKPSKMREAIAKRTVQSKQNVPHFYVTMVIEMDRAMALLKELNADVTDGKVTVNDLIVKACAVSLARVPEVNATWTPDGTVRRYAEAHIGIAVGIDEGLIIPVVRDCHLKPLRQISAEAKTLIGKARNGQLQPAEYSGGTFSISNLGMMGVDEFIAIINPPEAAILAIGGITRDAVVGENDAIAIKSRMKVTISADHRLLDGVVAARFVQEVKKALEAPFSLLS